MRAISHNALRALVFQRTSGLAKRARRINHIVNDNAGTARHIANDVHDLGFIRARAAFVDDRQIRVIQPFRQRAPRAPHHPRLERPPSDCRNGGARCRLTK